MSAALQTAIEENKAMDMESFLYHQYSRAWLACRAFLYDSINFDRQNPSLRTLIRYHFSGINSYLSGLLRMLHAIEQCEWLQQYRRVPIEIARMVRKGRDILLGFTSNWPIDKVMAKWITGEPGPITAAFDGTLERYRSMGLSMEFPRYECYCERCRDSDSRAREMNFKRRLGASR